MTGSFAGLDQSFCGCDDSIATVGPLIPVDVALQRGLALAAAVEGVERLPLEQAVGRVLAGPAHARGPMPPFDNAAMDGYALRLADLPGAGPWTLRVAGRIAAGDRGLATIPAGAALRIFTGAPVPEGCDAVVMQEAVTRIGGVITLTRAPEPGGNIRRAGEDLAEGAELLPAGRAIGAREAAALAAAGLGRVTVRRRLRVAIFSTGSELREPGEALEPGQIWNANRYHLRAALSQPWVDLADLGALPDTPFRLRKVLEEAAARADLVISTGGVSVGEEDHMPHVFRAAGGALQVMRLAMKPGKPLALGRLGGAVYIGLPGNPVSAFVSWMAIGARLAEAMAGLVAPPPRKTLVRAGFDLARRAGRCEFAPARICGYDGSGRQVIGMLSPSYAHRVALLAMADGLALIPAETERIAQGDLLEFMPF